MCTQPLEEAGTSCLLSQLIKNLFMKQVQVIHLKYKLEQIKYPHYGSSLCHSHRRATAGDGGPRCEMSLLLLVGCINLSGCVLGAFAISCDDTLAGGGSFYRQSRAPINAKLRKNNAALAAFTRQHLADFSCVEISFEVKRKPRIDDCTQRMRQVLTLEFKYLNFPSEFETTR